FGDPLHLDDGNGRPPPAAQDALPDVSRRAFARACGRRQLRLAASGSRNGLQQSVCGARRLARREGVGAKRKMRVRRGGRPKARGSLVSTRGVKTTKKHTRFPERRSCREATDSWQDRKSVV